MTQSQIKKQRNLLLLQECEDSDIITWKEIKTLKKIKTLKSNEVTFVCETCCTEADDRSYTS